MRHRIIRTRDEFLGAGNDLSGRMIYAFEGANLPDILTTQEIRDTFFLGFDIDIRTEIELRRKGAVFFHVPGEIDLPYRPYQAKLYDSATLMEGFDGVAMSTARDTRIYDWYITKGKEQPPPVEAVMQRLHDFGIGEAVDDTLTILDSEGMRFIGFMGGHALDRTHPTYELVVRLAHRFTNARYMVVTGGGPGVMEAANLGAFLAPQSEDVIADALEMLAEAPTYAKPSKEAWIESAQNVVRRFGGAAADSADYGWRVENPSAKDNPGASLSIPTWLYGHEPANLFSSHIAKYFSNSLREDALVTVAKAGIIYAEGAGGTVQEIFADAGQNYYSVHGTSCMVMLGRDYWTKVIPAWQCLEELAKKSEYSPSFKEMIALVDTADEVFDFIEKHPHVRSA